MCVCVYTWASHTSASFIIHEQKNKTTSVRIRLKDVHTKKMLNLIRINLYYLFVFNIYLSWFIRSFPSGSFTSNQKWKKTIFLIRILTFHKRNVSSSLFCFLYLHLILNWMGSILKWMKYEERRDEQNRKNEIRIIWKTLHFTIFP